MSGAPKQQPGGRETAGSERDECTKQVKGVDEALLAEACGDGEPPGVVGDMSRGGDEEGGGGKGGDAPVRDVVDEEGEGEGVVEEPERGVGGRGGVHDEGGGVVEVVGDDEEEDEMRAGRVAVQRVALRVRVEKQQVEVERGLQHLEG